MTGRAALRQPLRVDGTDDQVSASKPDCRSSLPRRGLGDLALLVVVPAAAILWLTWPDRPSLPRYDYGTPRTARFVPSDDCTAHPAGERCRVAREEYRQRSDDLIQQTRAADAAQAQALIGYRTAWASVIQAIGGLLTLIAASFAAYYARQAAIETRRGAKAARRQLKLARELGELELRSYIRIDAVQAKFANRSLALKFSLENSGAVIAKDIAVKIRLRAFYSGTRVAIDDAYSRTINSVLARSRHDSEIFHFDESSHPDLKPFLDRKLAFVTVRIEIDYYDYFKHPRRTHRAYGLKLSQMTAAYAPVRDRHVVSTETRPVRPNAV